MSRRDFLRLVGGAALLAPLAGSCLAGPGPGPVAPAPPHPAHPIRAVAFDLFTIFDPRSVTAAVEAALPGRGAAFALAWRTRQFEYAWLRAAAGRYADFRTITDDALGVTAREHRLELGPAVRTRLVDAYTELTPWPDSVTALHAMRRAGLRLASLANYSPAMIAALLRRAGIDDLFEHQISTDPARTFKPDPRAYQLGVDRFGLARDQIAFAAFGGWDAAGATWFGYPTFWVNRLGVELDSLATPTAIGRDLTELAAWIAARNSAG
jgi:2-haloacid dehalogenase